MTIDLEKLKTSIEKKVFPLKQDENAISIANRKRYFKQALEDPFVLELIKNQEIKKEKTLFFSSMMLIHTDFQKFITDHKVDVDEWATLPLYKFRRISRPPVWSEMQKHNIPLHTVQNSAYFSAEFFGTDPIWSYIQDPRLNFTLQDALDLSAEEVEKLNTHSVSGSILSFRFKIQDFLNQNGYACAQIQDRQTVVQFTPRR